MRAWCSPMPMLDKRSVGRGRRQESSRRRGGGSPVFLSPGWRGASPQRMWWAGPASYRPGHRSTASTDYRQF